VDPIAPPDAAAGTTLLVLRSSASPQEIRHALRGLAEPV
jgi:hypothetical protein